MNLRVPYCSFVVAAACVSFYLRHLIIFGTICSVRQDHLTLLTKRLYYDKLSPNVCVSSEIAAIMLHCVLA